MTPLTSIVPNGTTVVSLAIFSTLSIFDIICMSSDIHYLCFLHGQFSHY